MLQRSKPGLPHGQLVCVSASYTITTTDALLQLASAVGPQIAILQVQADIIDDWSEETVHQLIILAKRYGFLLWEGGRVLNPYLTSVGKPVSETIGHMKEIMEGIRRTYTKGTISVASWAVLATAWASGVTAENQEADMLIPSLKNAARETVAGIAQTITTEITADQAANHQPLPDISVDQTETCDKGLTPNYLNPQETGDVTPAPPRKSSTISLTQTITQHTETSVSSSSVTERRYSKDSSLEDALLQFTTPLDDIPLTPVLSRGLILCLPSSKNSRFTVEYRRSCLAAARANRDFVIGFISREPWTDISRADDILDTPDSNTSEVRNSREETSGRDSDVQHDWFVVLSPITDIQGNPSIPGEIDRQKSISSSQRESGIDEEVLSPTSGTRPPEPLSPQASLLSAIVEQAMAVREAASKDASTTRQSGRKRSKLNIIYIPIIRLGL